MECAGVTPSPHTFKSKQVKNREKCARKHVLGKIKELENEKNTLRATVQEKNNEIRDLKDALDEKERLLNEKDQEVECVQHQKNQAVAAVQEERNEAINGKNLVIRELNDALDALFLARQVICDRNVALRKIKQVSDEKDEELDAAEKQTYKVLRDVHEARCKMERTVRLA